jgi:endo-1,4-beta-mannosidase
VDDFIQDTPRSDASSSWTCNLSANSCLDTINNLDLMNMVENYMDYSSGSCQNSFTIGQVNLMRGVLRNFRQSLYDSTFTTSFQEQFLASKKQLNCFPNPTKEQLTIDLSSFTGNVQLLVRNKLGQVVLSRSFENTQEAVINLDLPSGVYFVSAILGRNERLSSKIIVQ